MKLSFYVKTYIEICCWLTEPRDFGSGFLIINGGDLTGCDEPNQDASEVGQSAKTLSKTSLEKHLADDMPRASPRRYHLGVECRGLSSVSHYCRMKI